jgi:hypothetical protein
MSLTEQQKQRLQLAIEHRHLQNSQNSIELFEKICSEELENICLEFRDNTLKNILELTHKLGQTKESITEKCIQRDAILIVAMGMHFTCLLGVHSHKENRAAAYQAVLEELTYISEQYNDVLR